jgi:hypothetical protein
LGCAISVLCCGWKGPPAARTTTFIFFILGQKVLVVIVLLSFNPAAGGTGVRRGLTGFCRRSTSFSPVVLRIRLKNGS